MKSEIKNRKLKIGFTLVELLVVISIVAVLVALLTPAMDKAIYQAELAVCGANHKAVTGGLSVYAAGSRRYYPDRQVAQETGFTVDIMRGGVDDRGPLRQAFPLKVLPDPFLKRMDLETTASKWIQDGFSSLFHGVNYPNEAAMRKLGDYFSWTTTDAGGQPVRHRFNVLACDSQYIANPNFFASHEDDRGVLANRFAQDGLSLLQPADDNVITFSYWVRADGVAPGRMDLNFAKTDGSVTRYDGIKAAGDDRMQRVPILISLSNSGYAGWRVQVPKD